MKDKKTSKKGKNPEFIARQGLFKQNTDKAREAGRKGGKSKSISKLVGLRKSCNNACPLWQACWARHAGYAQRAREVRDLREEGRDKEAVVLEKSRVPCALKNMPSSVVARAERLVIGGEEGFRLEILETLNRLGDQIGLAQDAKSKKDYLRELRETVKVLFGDKRRVDLTSQGEGMGLSAESFAAAWREARVVDREDEGKEE